MSESIKKELAEIAETGNFPRALKTLQRLQKHLALMGREHRVFRSLAADLNDLLRSQAQWQNTQKDLGGNDPSGFFKSFAVLKAEIEKALDAP